MHYMIMPIWLAISTVGFADDEIDRELVAVHNREREERMLPPLTSEPRLAAAAKVHALDMAAHSKMAHEGSDGSSPAVRADRQKYPYMRIGENVARGQRTAKEVMKTWMNSPPHRENILDEYSEIGVARAKASDGRIYWAVEFGRPIPQLDPTKAESQVVERLNHSRADVDESSLIVEPRLAKAARQIATDLAASQTLDLDQASEQPKPADRIEKSGYRSMKVAFCSAEGAPTPELLLKSLMDMPQHKDILHGPFKHLGVGYALTEKGRPYWCLILASPRN